MEITNIFINPTFIQVKYTQKYIPKTHPNIQKKTKSYDTFGSKSTEIEIESSQKTGDIPFKFSTASDFHQNLHSFYNPFQKTNNFEDEKSESEEQNYEESTESMYFQNSDLTFNLCGTLSPIFIHPPTPRKSSTIYSKYGRIYRKTCYSTNGLLFTIILNLCMIIINTFLLFYEFYLIFTHGLILYSTFKLPLFFIIFDICLTFILFVEITLHLLVIYKCQLCKYMQYGSEHKIDILVFLVSLFLCVFSMDDMFGISDFDNIGFLFVRILRDILRFIRCLIFGKFLYDSIIQWKRPKTKFIIGGYDDGCGSYLSSDWDDVKNERTNFVCV